MIEAPLTATTGINAMTPEEFESEIVKIKKLIPRMFYRMLPHYNPQLVTDELSPFTQAVHLQDYLLGFDGNAPAQIAAANTVVNLLTQIRAPVLVDVDIEVYEELNGVIGETDFVRREFDSSKYGDAVRFIYTDTDEKRSRILRAPISILSETLPDSFDLGDVIVVRINSNGFHNEEAACVCKTREYTHEPVERAIRIHGEFMSRTRCVNFYTNALDAVLKSWNAPVTVAKPKTTAQRVVAEPVAEVYG